MVFRFFGFMSMPMLVSSSSIVNFPTGKCMDGDSNSGFPADHTRMHIWNCNGSPNQQFELRDGKIMNTASGMCMDAKQETGYPNDRTELQLFRCHTVNNQQFEWRGSTIVNTASGKC